MLINYNDLYLYPIVHLHDYLIKHHGYSRADMVRFARTDLIAQELIKGGDAEECIKYLSQFDKLPPIPKKTKFIAIFEYTQENLENYLIDTQGYSDDDLDMWIAVEAREPAACGPQCSIDRFRDEGFLRVHKLLHGFPPLGDPIAGSVEVKGVSGLYGHWIPGFELCVDIRQGDNIVTVEFEMQSSLIAKMFNSDDDCGFSFALLNMLRA